MSENTTSLLSPNSTNKHAKETLNMKQNLFLDLKYDLNSNYDNKKIRV